MDSTVGIWERLKNPADDGHGVVYLSQPVGEEFERLYTRVRKKEQRILEDAQVALLPETCSGNPHAGEWRIRKQSARRIARYLEKSNLSKSDRLLDIGCGNGWFSHLLAKTLDANVLAIDINVLELEQAARTFKRDNLCFAYLDLPCNPPRQCRFSHIVFNSSFQYFENPGTVVELCLTLLREKGEIHIVDSPFYDTDKTRAARERSRDYYGGMGVPGMSRFYHHHAHALLDDYNAELLYRPGEGGRGEVQSPFPWIRIRK